MKVTYKNYPAVMARLVSIVLDWDIDAQREFCADFNEFLDKLADQDAFGTEGQLDPRGDQRG